MTLASLTLAPDLGRVSPPVRRKATLMINLFPRVETPEAIALIANASVHAVKCFLATREQRLDDIAYARWYETASEEDLRVERAILRGFGRAPYAYLEAIGHDGTCGSEKDPQRAAAILAAAGVTVDAVTLEATGGVSWS
jgi:hypothetical protein